MSTDRILRNTGKTLSMSFYSGGSIVDPGTVTVTITKADGTAVVTNAATTGTGAAARSYILAPQANLNVLKAVWTGTVSTVSTSLTSYHEIVGAHLFTEADARAFKIAGQAPLSDTTEYTDAEIALARDQITDIFQQHTGVSWVPRFYRHTFGGDNSYEIILPHREVTSVLSVTIGGTAQTASNYTADPITGVLSATSGVFTAASRTAPRNCVIEYEHGYAYEKDGVGRMALMALMARVVRKSTPDRAMAMTNELGTFRLAKFEPFGIPEVDSWLADHDYRLPV